ncbi:fructan beta-fructosidase [Catalinimonas alkaloidigena]|uniref:glycoside hydrolase family 32 protein n=1 Tax=Catalinimonas alkaloidigena TaxID=1075417 RepID=UPI002404E09D|nr:glycoside hydrolase family 32 protein [Catalinimonas alkaloidigena]MDF9799461.1 fructan beta-fructosidase [Catalinimonas alkaloidigena]
MRNFYISFVLVSLLLSSCSQPPETAVEQEVQTTETGNAYYQERYRPAYHFSPQENWMNDPNGLVYFDGEYHLFYQYNPQGNQWGNMSWGHAVSTDLLHWEHLPIALEMENGNMIFSGSAVVDKNNSSGLCDSPEGCMMAIYTAHTDKLQTQAIAYSNDRGRSWTKYEGNPVLDENMKDFRDPKVFWYAEGQKWVMSVAIPKEQKIRFYESQNLIDWNMMSEFGPQGFVDGIWECPDLFPLQVAETGEEKWVLLVSYNTDSIGSSMQYFVGDFNGREFTNDNTDDLILTLDYGRDFYAGVTWNNVPDEGLLLIGWINNWQYAGEIPTTPWRSAQSLVRKLYLHEFPEGIRLTQTPVEATQKLRQQHVHDENVQLQEGDNYLSLENIQGKQLEIIAEFAYEAIDTQSEAEALAGEFGVKVFKGEEQETIIGYDVATQSLFMDRTQSGDTSFHDTFSERTVALMPTDDGTVSMHIYVDHSVVEVFGNNGYVAMTNRVFPDPSQDGVEIYAIGGIVTLKSLDIWEVDSIWNQTVVKDHSQ